MIACRLGRSLNQIVEELHGFTVTLVRAKKLSTSGVVSPMVRVGRVRRRNWSEAYIECRELPMAAVAYVNR